MKDIIFIIGVGRSGTTLLQSMLHAHSEIDFSPETHFIKRYVRYELLNKKYQWSERESLRKALLKDKNFSDYTGEIPELLKNCRKEKNNPYLTVAFYRAFLSYRAKGKYVGDKDPMNVNFLPVVKHGFPEAKIIHIIRDPRDVISSRMKSEWGSGKPVIWHTSEYKFSIGKAMRDGHSLFGENYLEVRYERLLADNEKELNTICHFLNIGFEPGMLDHNSGAASLFRKDELKWKSNVSKPLDSSNTGKWEKNLPARQVGLIEKVLAETMVKLGYPVGNRKKSVGETCYRIMDLFIGGLFRLKFGR